MSRARRASPYGANLGSTTTSPYLPRPSTTSILIRPPACRQCTLQRRQAGAVIVQNGPPRGHGILSPPHHHSYAREAGHTQAICQTNTESIRPKPPTVQESPFIHGFLRLAGFLSSHIRPPLTPCPRCFCALGDSVHTSMCFFGLSIAPNSRVLALPITI